MKILELTNYSSGICGVWQRVKQESFELSKKGFKIKIFTSNLTKGSDEIASSSDKLGKIEIKRFPAKQLGGESFMHWDFQKEAIEFQPDIIIAHSYRHPHTTKALKIKKILEKKGKNIKVFLVTHAPFIEDNSTRSFFEKIIVSFYDIFIGKKTLKKFDKIITITKWEEPYLENLGINKNKIIYIPNGIPEEFFKLKSLAKNKKDILFLGRISPIKDLETLIYSLANSNLNLDIVGPAEECYKDSLFKIIKHLKLSNIQFKPSITDLKKKISLIDNYNLFVLPSKREAMPQSLIEAMARKKIVIASNNPGTREIINGKNGFLFEVGNITQLKEVISKANNLSKQKKDYFQNNARKTAEKFRWNDLINKLISLF
jgi:glycosyltransferase involved in cell wall biosynthesis